MVTECGEWKIAVGHFTQDERPVHLTQTRVDKLGLGLDATTDLLVA